MIINNKYYIHAIVVSSSLLLLSGCNQTQVDTISKQKEVKKIDVNNTIIWDGQNIDIEDKEYNQILNQYIDKKYPNKVQKWKYYKRERKNKEKKYTTVIGNLMWQDNKDSKKLIINWYDAIKYCNNLSLLDYSDWHLPSKIELKQLYKNKYKLKYYKLDHYWSSTTYTDNSSKAWDVYFGNGGDMDNFNMSYSRYIRCVRYVQ